MFHHAPVVSEVLGYKAGCQLEAFKCDLGGKGLTLEVECGAAQRDIKFVKRNGNYVTISQLLHD